MRAARDELNKKGEKVTLDAIHQITGGSLTEVYKIFKDLEKSDTQNTLNKPDPVLADIIRSAGQEMIERLYEACKKRADAISYAEYKNKVTREDEVLAELQRLDDIELKYAAKTEALEAQVKQAQAEMKHAQAEAKLAQAETRQARTEIELLKEHIKNLQQEKKG